MDGTEKVGGGAAQRIVDGAEQGGAGMRSKNSGWKEWR